VSCTLQALRSVLDIDRTHAHPSHSGKPFPPYANSTTPPSDRITPATATATKLLNSLTPHENIYTIPNILTFTRLLAAPAVGYCILTTQPTLALTLFFYAGLTDAIDGYLARRFNQSTVVGTIIDPMADKLLMTIAVVSLAIQSTIPLWLATIIIGRDVLLACSAIYFRWISLPPPKTFTRYWDFSLPSAEVRPTEISKINTLLQLLLIGSAMSLPVLRETIPTIVEAWNLGGVFEGWSYLVGATTVWSGLSYIGNKDAVKILNKKEIGEEEKMTVVRDEGPLYRKN
jgi:cardiolipin synthase